MRHIAIVFVSALLLVGCWPPDWFGEWPPGKGGGDEKDDLATPADMFVAPVADMVSAPDLTTGPDLMQNPDLVAVPDIRVLASGTLTVAPFNPRQPTILVAGDVWQNLMQYQGTAQDERSICDRANVMSLGDAASYSVIAVAVNGVVIGQTFLPPGQNQSYDVDLSANPFSFDVGVPSTFQIWAKLADIQSSASVGGATSGYARSGATVALGLNTGLTTGAWDANYVGKFNLRCRGQVSGSSIYASGTSSLGSTFVVRKSKPTITKQALASATLVSGQDQDGAKFQMSADPAGSISWKQVVFEFHASQSVGSTWTLSHFRFRRGATDSPASITIFDTNGQQLSADDVISAGSIARAQVVYCNEQTISGSGNVYALHWVEGGMIMPGDTVAVTFKRNIHLPNEPVTGYVEFQCGPQDLVADRGNTPLAPGTFVWSDQSEVPHNDQPASLDGSKDWTDDYLVEDLTASWFLTR